MKLKNKIKLSDFPQWDKSKISWLYENRHRYTSILCTKKNWYKECFGDDFDLWNPRETNSHLSFSQEVLEILLVIFVVWHLPPRIVIMTSGL